MVSIYSKRHEVSEFYEKFSLQHFNQPLMIFVLFAMLLLGMGVYLSFKVTNNKDDRYPIKTS